MHADKSNHAQGADRVRRMSCCFARRRCKRRLSHAQRSFCDMRTLSMRNGRKRATQHRRRQSWVLLTPRRSQQHSAPRANKNTGPDWRGARRHMRPISPGPGLATSSGSGAEKKPLSSFVSDMRLPQMSQSPTPKPQRERATVSAVRGSCACLLYTSPSPRDKRQSRMPSSA